MNLEGGHLLATARAVYAMVYRCCLVSRRVQWHGQAGGRLQHLGAARSTQEQRRHVTFSLRLRRHGGRAPARPSDPQHAPQDQLRRSGLLR